MNNEQKSKSMKKNNLKWILLNMMMAGLVMSSCSENEDIIPDKGQENEAKTSYVVAATVDGTSYLLAASSLDEGRISARGNGSEVLGASYWVFKNQKYLFGLVYNKGGNGTGASYYLTASGSIKEKYTYEYNRITTYGNWGDYVVTASTGNAATSEADNKGNLPQVLLFNYLHAEDGSQTSSSVMSENFLGNGEKVHLAGLVEANGKLYTSVIPGGMSKYGINRWPESVTDRDLISQADGGAASSSYKAGEIPSTQYPDKAFVAIYSGKSFNETPIIAETDKIGYACGRFRSQYYQTIWAADNGDIYVFSPGYGRTAESSADLKKVVGTKPSGVMRIKAGSTRFDDSYYVNLEEIGTRHPLYRCWHISGDYFLLQLYAGGVDEMKKGRKANVSELAVFQGETGKITPVTGLPADLAGFGGEPYGENGKMYMAVTVTGGDYPAFYSIDAKTGVATKGLVVEADGLSRAGKLRIQK